MAGDWSGGSGVGRFAVQGMEPGNFLRVGVWFWLIWAHQQTGAVVSKSTKVQGQWENTHTHNLSHQNTKYQLLTKILNGWVK